MMRQLFWITLSALGGLALHLAYVLFMPGLEMASLLDRFTSLKGRNTLVVLEPGEAGQLLASLPEMQTAACSYDLAAGPVTLDAVIPDSYWTVSVYSRAGELLFTLDDRQAGLNRLRLVLHAPGAVGPANPGAEEMRVETTQAEGLVLLQARAEDPAMAAGLKAALAASSCQRQP